MTDQPTTTLFRPTGANELRLVADTGFVSWPERLPEQPIFYPVTNEEYAIQIARDWNAQADKTGFVTRFEIDTGYLNGFDKQVVGDNQVHVEYWTPAERLGEFNAQILGRIEVLRAYRGDPPREVDLEGELARMTSSRG